MNSTEVSGQFQSAIRWSHLICGSFSFSFNVIVCLMILFDSDCRGKSYRKYLFSLQLSSTLADACINAYTPFVQSNCNTVYSDSALAKVTDMVTAMTIYFVFINGTTASYFLCVYYRRNNFLTDHTILSFHGWKYRIFLIVFMTCEILLQCGQAYIFSDFRYAGEKIPKNMLWLKQKNAFIYVGDEVSVNNLREICKIYVVFFTCTSSFIALLMIIQLIREIRKEGHLINCASLATKRYQIRAVFSLVMQGVIPGIFILIPFTSMSIFVRYAMVVGTDVASRNIAASEISILCVSLMSFHGLAHSLTVVACSQSYRRSMASRIRTIFSKILLLVCGKVSRTSTAKVAPGIKEPSAFTSGS